MKVLAAYERKSVMIAYGREAAAGGGETKDDHDIVCQSLIHCTIYSPKNASSQLKSPTALLAQDQIIPRHSLNSLGDPRACSCQPPPLNGALNVKAPTLS